MPAPKGRRARGIALAREWSSIRQLRQARGLSQSRLAELAGVSERTVRAIERGAVERPQRESLRRLAAVLAYGDSHRERLLERWTASTAQIPPEVLGIPDWEIVHRRIGLREPADGGLQSTVVCDVTFGAGRLPRHVRHLYVHSPMAPTGSPVLWKVNSGLPVDISGARFEVVTGGVIDDFFLYGDIAGLAIRPDPVMAQQGPFLVEYSMDLTRADPLAGVVETEWMNGSTIPLQVAAMVVRFTDEVPPRVWSVKGSSAPTAERHERLQVAPDGTAQVCFHDLAGVFGIQWEWGDEPS